MVRVESTHLLIQLVQNVQYHEPRQCCIGLLDIGHLVEGLEEWWCWHQDLDLEPTWYIIRNNSI
jgi:hypothetical protein